MVVAAVIRRAEGGARLLELDQQGRAPLVAIALDLLGNRAVAKAEDLKAAAVGQHRPVPAHEAVPPTTVCDEFRARLPHQVIGVGEDDALGRASCGGRVWQYG